MRGKTRGGKLACASLYLDEVTGADFWRLIGVATLTSSFLLIVNIEDMTHTLIRCSLLIVFFVDSLTHSSLFLDVQVLLLMVGC